MSDGTIARLRALPEAERRSRRRAVRVLIVTGVGLNCEAETAAGFRLAGARPDLVHLSDLLDGRTPHRLAAYPILAFIGGFSFGDHLGAGAVFANRLRFRLYDQLLEFIAAGGLALGICNGFQTMVRLGLLPGLDGDYRTPRATLAPNDRLGYRDAWVSVACESASPCLWTRDLTTLDLPARHGEGKFIAESPELLARLIAQGQVALRYVDPDGVPTQEWPHNPNGSAGAVAGVCDPSGRLLGMMPHPDAFLYAWQHPRWRAGAPPGAGEGLALFQNGVDAVAARV